MRYDVEVDYQRKGCTTILTERINNILAKSQVEARSKAKRQIAEYNMGGLIHQSRVVDNHSDDEPALFVGDAYQIANISQPVIVRAVFNNRKGISQITYENQWGAIVTESEAVFRRLMKPKETIEYWSLYPNENVYKRTDSPVKSSMYGVDQLVQLKITKRGDKIVRKELIGD